MRENKFRAFDKVEKKWYQNVLPLSDGMFVIEDVNGYKEVVVVPDFINERAPNEFAIVQFTGQKDRKGKEIYDGHVCTSPNGLQQVSFNDYWGSFILGPNTTLTAPLAAVSEIIGNIYDNPELIKL